MATMMLCRLESRWPPRSHVFWNQDGRHNHISAGTMMAAMILPDEFKMAATIMCLLESRWPP